jgi:hypothetical protein
VIAMFQPAGPYRALLDEMQAVLDDDESRTARFEDQDFDAPGGPWALVAAALRASNDTPQLKASTVTKILHRKRPQLVPIFDRRVAAVYGVKPRTPWRLWEPLRDDLIANSSWLTLLAAAHQTPDGRQLTALRALDIVLWEHSWGCTV